MLIVNCNNLMQKWAIRGFSTLPRYGRNSCQEVPYLRDGKTNSFTPLGWSVACNGLHTCSTIICHHLELLMEPIDALPRPERYTTKGARKVLRIYLKLAYLILSLI